MSNVRYLMPPAVSQPDEYQQYVARLTAEVMEKLSFRPSFQAAVIENAKRATESVRKWHEPFALSLPPGISPTDAEAIQREVQKLVEALRNDHLCAVLAQSFLLSNLQQRVRSD